MHSRRQFLGALGLPAVALSSGFDPRRLARDSEAGVLLREVSGTPAEVAEDEDYWDVVARAFAVDRSRINLNNGGVSPAPTVATDALQRLLEFSNQLPSHNMWHTLEPQRETVRRRLAARFGCDAEELAFTRNASEGLQICQFGFDLARGDEVLTTNQDYPRMLASFRQRERREGVVLKQISLPVPCEDDDEIVRRFEAAVTERTRLILMCHVINLTGQVLPVKRVVAMARKRGIPVIVDGAHSFAHLDFTFDQLDCDYFATSLHKWLFAPIGTGLLYVRRSKIKQLWPLMAADEELADDIRKFEQIGTHPVAYRLAVGEALAFHEGLGGARKLARLVHLRNLWAERLGRHERVHLHTSLKPGFAGGIANVEVEGLDTGELYDFLWQRYGILTSPIRHAEFTGLRISPSVYTRPAELEYFCEAMETALESGIGG